MNEDTVSNIMAYLTEYGLNIVFALLIFFVGRWIVGYMIGTMKKVMTARNVDLVLITFLSSLLYYLLLIVVVLAAISQLGVQTTSFIAILGAAGLAVGLALQGSLANFAAGVLIILFRPFKIGDFIEAGGTTGIVEEIGILITMMKTPDNKKILVPNSNIMGGNITNFSANETRRVDLVFGVSYGDDIDKVKSVLQDIVANDERVLKEPACTIAVSKLNDSSVDFVVRPWVKAADYWGVFFGMTETVKKRFDAEGISIPFPQRDVHLFQEK
jgi:small conductance mechanosensitive channel